MDNETFPTGEQIQLDPTALVEAVKAIREKGQYDEMSLAIDESMAKSGALYAKTIPGLEINGQEIDVNIVQYQNSTTYEITSPRSPFSNTFGIDGYWLVKINPAHNQLLEAVGYSGSEVVPLSDKFIQALSKNLVDMV